jgi:hypothetical protein
VRRAPGRSRAPRFLSSSLTPRERRVYVGATIYFLVATAAMIWPVYALFSRVRPFVLGMPFALAYLAAVLVVSFLVLLTLYVWEGRAERRSGRAGEDDS